MAVPELLDRLLRAPGPSGHEDAPARIWREAAAAFAEVTTDTVGSSVARVAGEGPLLAVVGHVDEVGLIVTHVRDDGLLSFRRIGGGRAQVWVGQRVELLTRDGAVRGVVGRKRTYATKDADEPAAELEDLHIDVGARDGDEARALVRPGDPAVAAVEPWVLRGGRIASRALDNRVGAYAALEVARRLAEGEAGANVAAVASVQEETLYTGARTAIYALEPAVALVYDVTWATDIPGVDLGEDGHHPLGSGAAIMRSPANHPRVFDLLVEAAEAESIPHTIEVQGKGSSTDADAIYDLRAGIPTGVVSIPLRYMHSPGEIVDLADVEAAIALGVAFARRLTPDVTFTR